MQTQQRVLAPRSNSVVQMNRFQRSDVTAARHAHISEVTFFQF